MCFCFLCISGILNIQLSHFLLFCGYIIILFLLSLISRQCVLNLPSTWFIERNFSLSLSLHLFLPLYDSHSLSWSVMADGRVWMTMAENGCNHRYENHIFSLEGIYLSLFVFTFHLFFTLWLIYAAFTLKHVLAHVTFPVRCWQCYADREQGGPWCFGGPMQLAFSAHREDRLCMSLSRYVIQQF